MKIKDLITMLEKDGWHQVRMKGSHRPYGGAFERGHPRITGEFEW